MIYALRFGWLSATIGLLVLAAAPVAPANNIRVTNVGLTKRDSGARTANVVFDLAWDNSWRGSNNWDAAWVFVKFRAPGSNNWEHAKLSTVNANHTAPNGTIDVGSDGTNGMGVFVYRAAGYTGSVNYAKTRLRWQYGSNGYNFAEGAMVDVSVHAIEMVYIPAGAFWLGSGGSEGGAFYQYPTLTTPYLVTNETEITVGTTNGNLYYPTGGYIGDGLGPISNAFPKGYAAFYCMKYEISQGQYAEFLNKLTATQAGTRFPNKNGNARHTISQTATNYIAGAPDRACNWVLWADESAYADWAALRPMTELEFEKACRGPAPTISNEYAWGNATAPTTLDTTGCFGTDGSGTETPKPTNANCLVSGGLQGPTRVGIFATTNSTRQSSGASYYGVMELSGNVWERPVTVGTGAGRSFQGTHGDGVLDASGNATGNADWPGSSGAGCGCRGGCWYQPSGYARVSDRGYAANMLAGRGADEGNGGWRAVRTAP